MARTFAQHAEAGVYHLETRYCEPNHWEWIVFKKGKKEAVFFGDTTTLEAAKKNAMMAVGLYSADWRDIGPVIEAPDLG